MKVSVFLRRGLALLALFGVGSVGIGSAAHAETWHRADTHHFTIYSDGSAGQLEDFAHEAERFDSLLRTVFNRPAKKDPAKLTIYLLKDAAAVGRLYSRGVAGFYSVQPEQTFAVGNRQYGSDREDLNGKQVLFHEYAHHFMFHNFAIPAPAWFVEGFAEFVATAEFRRNGDWTFGVPAHHRAYSVRDGPGLGIEKLLQDDYSRMSAEQTGAFYGWAWALTHMLYSDPDERGNQINRYLQDLNSGMDSLSAATRNFGDLDDLEKQLRSYVRKSMLYTKSDKPLPYIDDVSVTTLDAEHSELTELTLDRLVTNKPDALRDRLIRFASEHDSARGWLQLAELEFVMAHRGIDKDLPHDFSAAQTAVDLALALDPKLPRAHVLKGRLLLEPFDHDEDPDPASWEKARAYFVTANQLDSTDAQALYQFAQTYRRSGEAHEMVGPALESAFTFRPESTEFRSALAMHYANEGQYDRAIGLLNIIANNPHGNNGSAKAAIARLKEAKANGTSVGLIEIEDKEDEANPGDTGGA